MTLVELLLLLTFLLQGSSSQLTLIVDKSGRGNFSTINDAISAAPIHSQERIFIKINAGVYHEIIRIPKEKTNLTLIGDGIGNTIISGDRSTNDGFPVNDTSTILIAAAGFLATDITFENIAGPNKNQSVALTAEGNNIAFYRCRFSGYQDTLYVKKGVQFFRECEILGTIDFIFGDSKTLLQNCRIYVRNPQAGRSNTVTAQGKETSLEETGLVLQNCRITAARDSPPALNVKIYLGRPWKNYSTTVIMQSFLDTIIDPSGWLYWEGRNVDTVYCAEYGNTGPGAKTRGRVKWGRQIISTEASKFTIRNFLGGEAWIRKIGVPYYPDLA